MKLCQHPPSEVTADILEGDSPNREVQWCRLCGAVRIKRKDPDIPNGSFDYTSPWIEPESNKDVSGLDSRYPVVLYFGSKAEADDFISMAQEAHPNLTERKL